MTGVTELVERLRQKGEQVVNEDYIADALEAQQAEIERLRGALQDIAEMRVPVLPSRFMDESMAEYARAALGEATAPGGRAPGSTAE